MFLINDIIYSLSTLTKITNLLFIASDNINYFWRKIRNILSKKMKNLSLNIEQNQS